MKKILFSLLAVGTVAAAVAGVTGAYFTDTEQSTENTLTAGTIDISVDNKNPWSREGGYQLLDMKPGQVDYTNFTVKNVGSNPANVYKTVGNIQTSDNGVNEPECDYDGGTWTGGSEGVCEDYEGRNDIDTALEYDLSVKVKDAQGVEQWSQMLYNRNKTVNQLTSPMFLGMVPAGWSMDVVESYHLKANTENWAQSDSMTFDIVLTAEQLKGTAVLENKDPSNWMVMADDDVTGTLTYGVKDAKFDFAFSGKAPSANTGYSLVMYEEAFSTPAATGFPRNVIVLGAATSDGSGNVSIPSTSVELNQNISDMKVWLVRTSDLVGSTLSGWNPGTYLFDTGLIDYYDTDL